MRFGAEKAARPELCDSSRPNLARVAILDWTNAVAFQYARLRTTLERRGTPIGNLDLLIAAHALAEHATVVARNVRHFGAVPDLAVENWNTAPDPPE